MPIFGSCFHTLAARRRENTCPQPRRNRGRCMFSALFSASTRPISTLQSATCSLHQGLSVAVLGSRNGHIQHEQWGSTCVPTSGAGRCMLAPPGPGPSRPRQLPRRAPRAPGVAYMTPEPDRAQESATGCAEGASSTAKSPRAQIESIHTQSTAVLGPSRGPAASTLLPQTQQGLRSLSPGFGAEQTCFSSGSLLAC